MRRVYVCEHKHVKCRAANVRYRKWKCEASNIPYIFIQCIDTYETGKITKSSVLLFFGYGRNGKMSE